MASLPLPQRASSPPVFFVKPAATQSIHPDSSSAPAADSADFAILSALPIPTLPAVSKQALAPQHTPLMNFPHCPGQPMFVKKFCAADLPRRASSCANLRCRFFPLVASLPLPQCASSPPVFFVKPTTTTRPDSLSWPAHVRQKILRCRSSPSGLQLRKSALPIFPTGGIAATAPVCVQPASIFRQAYDYDSSRLIVLASPCSSKNLRCRSSKNGTRTMNPPDSSSAPAADSADFADSSPARCV